MIKVLHIITKLDISKASTSTIETVARLDKYKYQASVVSGMTLDPEGIVHEQLKDYKIDCTFINELRDEINPWLDFLSFVKLFKIIRNGKYDIVHTHLCKAGMLGRCAAKMLRVKHIVHTPHIYIFCHHFSKFFTLLSFLIEKFIARFTNIIITSSINEKLKHIELSIGKPSKLVQIYSGVDFNNINITKDNSKNIKRILNIDNDSIVFGNTYNSDLLNRNNILIKAMSDVVKVIPNSFLVIVEEGTQKEELIKLSETLNISNNIKFVAPSHNRHDLINMFDIFVICSLNKEIEEIILEAMYCEKPVIVSDTTNLQELIVESKTGILVAYDDCNSFSEAMINLAKNKEQIVNYGINGRKLAIDNFSMETMLSKIEDLYSNLITNNT